MAALRKDGGVCCHLTERIRRAFAFRETHYSGATALPSIGTVIDVFLSRSVLTTTCRLRSPALAGCHLIVTICVSPAASEVSAVIPSSCPSMATMRNGLLPLTLTFLVTDSPMFTVPSSALLGETVSGAWMFASTRTGSTGQLGSFVLR